MTPVSDLGRMVLVLMLLLSMFLIPYQSYKLIQLLTKQSEFAGSIPSHDKGPKHIVVLGDISSHRILHLFRELFHKDQNYRNIRVVILSLHEPGPDTRKLLWHPFYKTRIIFLVGSALIKKDLKRVALSNAKSCFILTDQYSTNAEVTDRETQLQLLAVKDFAPDIYTCVQINRPGWRHMSSDLSNISMLITDDLKLSILARNCTVPGFSTFMSNLLSTYSASDLNQSWVNTWREEYHFGCSHEIYSVVIPVSMQGMTFTEAARFLYIEHSIVMFAIHKNTSPLDPILNPGSLYTLASGERAYVMALHRGDSMKVSNIGTSVEFRDNDAYIELQSLPEADDEYWTATKENIESTEHGEDRITEIRFEEPRTLTEALLYDCDNIGEWFDLLVDYGDIFITQDDAILRKEDKLNNHIIVYGNVANLVSFVAPLRLSTNKEQIPILILITKDIPDNMWRIIGRFKDIYLYRGSPESPHVQKSCGFIQARAFVLLTSPNDLGNKGGLPDTKTILLYRQIKSNYPSLLIVGELSMPENVRFIKPGLGSKAERHNSQSGLSNLSVSGRLLHPEYHYNPYFSSGSVFSSSLADSLICHLLSNRNLLKLVELMSLGGSYPNQVVQSAHMYQVEVPPSLHNAEYKNVFEYYIKENTIALGIYRSSGTRGSDEAYVYTNPLPNAVVKQNDNIFILSTRQPEQHNNVIN